MKDNVVDIFDGYVMKSDEKLRKDFLRWADNLPNSGLVRPMLNKGMFQFQDKKGQYYRVFVDVYSESDIVPSDRHPKITEAINGVFYSVITNMNSEGVADIELRTMCNSSIFCKELNDPEWNKKMPMFNSSPKTYGNLMKSARSGVVDKSRFEFMSRYNMLKDGEIEEHEQFNRQKEDLFRALSRQDLCGECIAKVMKWNKRKRKWKRLGEMTLQLMEGDNEAI
jgi:hypothetical protein